jgi:hypothetical protein
MSGRDDDSSTSQGSRGRPPAGLAVRAVPLVAAAALLVLGLTRRSFASEASGTLAIGFGLVALSGVLHALAVRFPRRYALDGFAWVSAMVAVLLAVVFATAGGR